MSSISRLLRSKLKQPDGSWEDGDDEEEERGGGGSGRGGGREASGSAAAPHDGTKHSIDDILATSPEKEEAVESDGEGTNLHAILTQ